MTRWSEYPEDAAWPGQHGVSELLAIDLATRDAGQAEILGAIVCRAYLAPMTSCVKCTDPAQVVMSFAYAMRTVWLRDLDATYDRFSEIPLCEMHADRLVVPIGWTLDDDRHFEPPLFLAADVA